VKRYSTEFVIASTFPSPKLSKIGEAAPPTSLSEKEKNPTRNSTAKYEVLTSLGNQIKQVTDRE